MHYIRELHLDDIDDMSNLEKLSGGIVTECLRDGSVPNFKAFGLYIKCNDGTMKAIGYCSYESAEAISSSTYWSPTSLMISEFFIDENYRNQGYGTELMEYVLHEIPNTIAVFINADNINNLDWYKKFGFSDLIDGSIVKPEKIEE